MYMIMALINEERLDDVINGLLEHEITGITISDTRGFGNIHIKSGLDKQVNLNKKVKLEIVVTNDEFKKQVIDLLFENCHDTHQGAGKIFVYDVKEVYRIRTGERDSEALKTY